MIRVDKNVLRNMENDDGQIRVQIHGQNESLNENWMQDSDGKWQPGDDKIRNGDKTVNEIR